MTVMVFGFLILISTDFLRFYFSVFSLVLVSIKKIYQTLKTVFFARCGGLMVNALISGSSGPGSSPGRGHCVVFLGKTLYSHSASLHPGV